jgi:AcrR family transcriptional regulator
MRRYEEVLEVAGKIFCEKGYEATSTQDIADSLGILKGSLYYYTQTKENLLFELIQGALQGSIDNLQRIAAKDDPAIDRLRELICVHVEYLTANLVGTTLSLHEHRSLSPSHAKLVSAVEHEYQAGFEELVAAGQKDGSIRADLDPKLVALGVLGAINWPYRWYRPGRGRKKLKPEVIGEQFAEMLIAGLSAQPARRARKNAAGRGSRR